MRPPARLRRLAETALEKIHEQGERENERAYAKMSPAEREHYDAWVGRTQQFAETGVLQEGRLVGKALLGPAGEAVHGVTKAPRDPAPIKDPAEREAAAARERVARAQARTPYVAMGRPPIQRVRFAGDPAPQLAQMGLAARPDLVYGVYRVPDGGVVEWEVVHAASAALPPAPAPAQVHVDARRRWVERRVGDAPPWDEEIALGYLARAGIGPERTLGINRDFSVESHEDGETRTQLAVVKGVHVLHATPAAPLEVGPLPEGVRNDRLNWEAVAQAVAPVRRGPEPVPSPWPYLPLTSGELLTSYLEVVGIDPADCYGVQVTYERAFDLMGRSHRSGFVRIHGPGRTLGGSQIVITYRDQPQYAAGRERFVAYSREVLHAELWRGLSGGEAIPKPTPRTLRILDRAYDIATFFDSDVATTNDFFEPPRYCWPPVD